jgi:hypothetical protein
MVNCKVIELIKLWLDYHLKVLHRAGVRSTIKLRQQPAGQQNLRDAVSPPRLTAHHRGALPGVREPPIGGRVTRAEAIGYWPRSSAMQASP